MSWPLLRGRFVLLNLAEDVIEVHCHLSSLHSVLDLFQFIGREERHQGLGGEPSDEESEGVRVVWCDVLPVLGSLLVVPDVRHVPVDLVGCSKNVVNYFAEVSIKVCSSHLLQFILNKINNNYNN